MGITRLHHIGLTVADMEASLRFYEGGLGFSLLSRRTIDQPWLSQLLGVQAAVVDAADLAVPNADAILQLFQFTVPLLAAVQPALVRPGSSHLAFVTSDLGTLYESLVARGVEPLAAPVSITSGANAGGSLVCLLDPDGVTVEFFEPPRSA